MGDANRLLELLVYEILDTPQEKCFDALAIMASKLCGTPIALISFLDGSRQWIKASVGTCAAEIPSDNSFCSLTISQSDVLVINDTSKDPRVENNPLVTGDAHIRFYAGVSLLSSNGQAIGTLCVCDLQPREFQSDGPDILRMLGSQIMAQLELRKNSRQLVQLQRERARQDTELVERERLLRLVIDLVPHHIFAKDREGRFLFINRAAAESCGRTPAEMIGRSERELRPDLLHTENFLRDDQEVIDGGIAKIIPEELITYPDNQIHILHTTKIPFIPPGTDKWAVLGVAVDITERKRTEEELLRFSRMLELILDNVPACVFWKDTDLKFLGCNRLFAETMGVESPAFVLGKTDYVLPWKASAEAFRNDDRRVLDTRKPLLNFEEAQCLADGTTRWVKTSKTPLIDTHGDVFGVLGVFMDITSRKLAEDEVRTLNSDLEERVIRRTAELSAANSSLVKEVAERKQAELELIKAFRVADEANNAKSAFLARMSHEIRTPMNGIIGMNFLLKQTALTLKQSQYASKIDTAAQNLLAIINGILDFSKIEAGKMELENIEFNLEQVLFRLVDLTSVQANRKALECKISLAANTPMMLIGDPLRLGQVLTNLVSNAIKFTEKGEVEVAVTPLEREENQVLLGFKITDTGIGMNAQQLSRLFEPFSQSDISTSRNYGGTGLGLAIAKRFVQLMGGAISVESTPGRGSVFNFTARFRLDPKSNAGSGTYKYVSAPRHALLVNSDPASAMQISRLLTELACDVVCAESVAGAVRELTRQNDPHSRRYDVVLLDCSPPNKIRIEDARRIQAECPGVALPPFVLIASSDGGDMQVHVEDIGFDSFAIKPLVRSTLFDATQRAMTKKSKVDSGLHRPDSAALKGARILLVEDNEMNQQIAIEMLRLVGCHVTLAVDGREVLKVLVDQPPELQFSAVLMDIQLPGLDGYSTTRQIRSDARFEKLPIIAITADAVSGVKEKCLAAGMNDYLTKPINPDELYDVMSNWVRK